MLHWGYLGEVTGACLGAGGGVGALCIFWGWLKLLWARSLRPTGTALSDCLEPLDCVPTCTTKMERGHKSWSSLGPLIL